MPNTFSMTGRLGKDADLRYSNSGKAVARARLADTPRKYNKDTSQWEDAGETLWLGVTVFGPDAERFGEQARKGDKVTVYGRLQAEKWTDKASGEEREAIGVIVDAFTVHERRDGQQGSGGGGFQQQRPAVTAGAGQANDPWAVTDDPPPWS